MEQCNWSVCIDRPPTYTLSRSLSPGDGSPIRSLSASPPSLLAGSQSPVLSELSLGSEVSLTHHSNLPISGQVTAVLHLPPSTRVRGGGVASFAVAGLDRTIRLCSSAGEQLATLDGHTHGVISLALMVDGRLVSGSWDGTARIWDLDTLQCLQTLPDHENGVSVVVHPSGTIVTASSGKSGPNGIEGFKLRFWSPDVSNTFSLVNIANPHAGPIRSICLPPNPTSTSPIITCSNDSTTALTSLNGEVTARMPHPDPTGPLLLAVSTVPTSDGGFVICTAAESGSVAVHSSAGDLLSTIAHPGTIWTVGAFGEDIITGCHDGKVRVFTADPERVAGETELAEYEEECTSAAAARTGGPSQMDLEKLPKWESRFGVQAKGDGSIQVFNKVGVAIAARWEGASSSWIEVGEVTGSNENAGTVDGVSFDHVIPIEIERPGFGVQNLKIGYNDGQNPFEVAQAFIDKHELQQGYLGQIADYIRERAGTQANVIDMSGSGGTQAPPPAPFVHLPVKNALFFSSGVDKLPKLLAKLHELNPDAEKTALGNLADVLSVENRYHISSVSTSGGMEEAARIVSAGGDSCFPAVDLLRLTSIHPDAVKSSDAMFWGQVLTSLCDALEAGDPASVALPLVGYRLAANLMKVRALNVSSMVHSKVERLAGMGERILSSTLNKNVKSAVMAFGYNACVAVASTGGAEATWLSSSAATVLIRMLVKGAEVNEGDRDKAAGALGTLALREGQMKEIVKKALLGKEQALAGSGGAGEELRRACN